MKFQPQRKNSEVPAFRTSLSHGFSVITFSHSTTEATVRGKEFQQLNNSIK